MKRLLTLKAKLTAVNNVSDLFTKYETTDDDEEQDGDTALHVCALHNALDCAKLLLGVLSNDKASKLLSYVRLFVASFAVRVRLNFNCSIVFLS